MDCQLKIGSLNVRGLNNRLKRRNVFRYIHRNKYDIFLLQETYSTSAVEHIWRQEWGAKIYFSHGDSNSRGVAVLCSNQCSPLDIRRDEEGRLITVKVTVQDTLWAIVNVYAPNRDTPQFMERVFNVGEIYKSERVIIAGDFNLVLDEEMDSYNRVTNNKKSASVIKTFVDNENFQDVFRVLNPDTKRYTCIKRNPSCASRIDFMLTSPGIINNVKMAQIISMVFSDHNIVDLNIVDEKWRRGPGIWRLNTELLNHPKIDKEIRTAISNHAEKYGHLKPDDRWDELKHIVKCIYIEKGQLRGKKKRQNLSNLSENLSELDITSSEKCNKVTLEAMELVKFKIKQLEEERTRGAIVRSRVQWDSEGERCTKYFFALEKRNFARKCMRKIIDDNGQIVEEQRSILRAQKQFYEELYQADREIEFNITNETNIYVKEIENQMLGAVLTQKDIQLAIQSMPNNKAPGYDGLPGEFYK